MIKIAMNKFSFGVLEVFVLYLVSANGKKKYHDRKQALVRTTKYLSTVCACAPLSVLLLHNKSLILKFAQFLMFSF